MRREFPNGVKRAAHERSGGICECHLIPALSTSGTGCGQPLGPGNTFYEHIICDGIGGAPTLENCAVLTKTCWRAKTAAYDLPVIAKAKRRRDRNIGIRKSGSGLRHPFLRKKMNGEVERRTR